VDWASHCAVVIPCLNEARTVRALVAEVRQHLPFVLVVDDGSIDATGAEARASGAEVLHNEKSLGKGSALAQAWRRCHELGYRWAVSLDGDGQHAPEDLPAFLARAESTGAALVVGNRMDQSGEIPWLRRRVNRWMSRRLSRWAGRELPDTQCGFRLMRLDVWSELAPVAARFEIESEVLMAFVAAGERVEFVPIQVIYRTERSKIHPVRDTWRWFLWWRQAARRHRIGRRTGEAVSRQTA
jgi:glycosyltransferase involved in cell wall biosynthesis